MIGESVQTINHKRLLVCCSFVETSEPFHRLKKIDEFDSSELFPVYMFKYLHVHFLSFRLLQVLFLLPICMLSDLGGNKISYLISFVSTAPSEPGISGAFNFSIFKAPLKA